MVLSAIAGVALGAGLAGQSAGQGGVGYRDAIEMGDNGLASTQLAKPIARAGPIVFTPNGAPATPAESSLATLAAPGYALTTSAAAALADVRAAVADTVALQQLRAQILAPAPPPGLSSAMLSDLVSLVRQAQVSSVSASSAPAAVQPIDAAALSQAESAVRAAQAALVEATKARDNALAAGSPAPGLVTSSPPSLATTAPGSVAAGAATNGTDSAAIHDAQTRLAAAQQQLQALIAGPSTETVRQAQQALAAAVASASVGPSEQQLAAARRAVDLAQKDYDAANQSVSAVAQPVNPPMQAGKPSDSTRNQPGPGPAAVADPAAARAAAGTIVGGDAQRLADTQANLDSAKAALATLEQQVANASHPESQAAVIAARKRLADLAAPPDPASIAAAQGNVASMQQQLNALLAQTPVAAPTTVAASSAPASTAAVASPSAAAAPASAAAAADPVAAAAQRLTEAQNHLSAIVASGTTPLPVAATNLPPAGASAGATTSVPASSLPPLVTAPPAGSTTTQVTPEIQAEQARLASAGQVSKNDLTALQMSLRARYVLDAVLESEHLHPSAFAISPVAALSASGPAGRVSSALTWPLAGPITQAFGVPELGVGSPHTGIDIGVAIGTPVTAAASGIVSFAGGDPATSYGYYTIIDHGMGVSTLYAHLALPPFLHPGQFLPQGGLIGLSGSTGFSTGPHVHFEVRLNGVPVDPLKVLPPSGSR